MTAAVAAGLAGGAGVASADSQVAGCAQSGMLVNCKFNIKGEFALDVPAGVTSIKVTAIGENGQSGFAPGGLAGLVTADVPVKPGSKLYVNVGEGGGTGTTRGGGFSGIGTESIKTNRDKGMQSRLLVAPGGGGGSLGAGGDAGTSAPGTTGGKAGTTTAGGAGGTGSPDGGSGALGTGGAATGTGAGGGAGYFGGGGGAPSGGGGGGSFLIPSGGTDHLAAREDAAEVLIQFTSLVPIIPIPGLGDLGSSDLGGLPSLGSS
ncbi:hypothetical protein [Rhodococcus sp. NPDC127528]|uniref:hypothetical protein n=1 Tax=unclassified Rhodococcus (in: high G+C Gram-positive bacteria) TaxID=192944 RepID=UPI00363A7CFC